MRERESEPNALGAPEGFFFRVYNSSPRSASSASPELEALKPPSRPSKSTLWDDFDRLMERKTRGDHPILLESLECVDVRARRCTGPGDMRAEALARAVCSCSCGIRRGEIPPISSGLWSLVAIQCSTHIHTKKLFRVHRIPKVVLRIERTCVTAMQRRIYASLNSSRSQTSMRAGKKMLKSACSVTVFTLRSMWRGQGRAEQCLSSSAPTERSSLSPAALA